MVQLNKSEIERIESFVAWPRGMGYVLNYSDKTFGQMFKDEFEIAIDDDRYVTRGTSKRHRLISFCLEEPLPIVLPVLQHLLKERQGLFSKFSDRPTVDLEQPFRDLMLKLESVDNSPDTAVFDAPSGRPNVEAPARAKDADALRIDLKRLLRDDKPEVAIDRLHTYCMKELAQLLKVRGIKYGRNEPLHSLFGKYRNDLKHRRTLTKATETAMKSAISTFEEFNDIRNKRSLAHGNELLNKHEARYLVDIIIAKLRFIRAIEIDRWQ